MYFSGPSPVRSSFEYDESDDDLKGEDISFTAETGPLTPAGRSISLDPGALAGMSVCTQVCVCACECV